MLKRPPFFKIFWLLAILITNPWSVALAQNPSFTPPPETILASPTPPTAPVPLKPGQPKTDLLFILDVSGSMNSMLENNLMIDWAKLAIQGAVAKLPPEAEVGLRVYAHRVEKANRDQSCVDTELLVPIGAGNGSLVAASAQALKPKGWTPIAYSLEQAAGDFAAFTERLHTIILLSDGEETCGGDPLAAAKGLLAKGYRVKIFTIGFNVQEEARRQLEALAREFGGTYSDVRSGLALEQELTQLTQQTFLIEKEKKLENRIRGGSSMETAVPIELEVRYQLDHHQRKGEYDYFVINALAPGQEFQLQFFPTPKCLQILGSQVQEKEGPICDQETYRFSILDKNGKELDRIDNSRVDSQEIGSWKVITQEDPPPYYVVVGSPLGDMHRDNEFQILGRGTAAPIAPTGDAGLGRDAGDDRLTALSIQPGLHNGMVSIGDPIDIYKLDVPQYSILKVVLTPIKKEGTVDFNMEVTGGLGEVLGSGYVGVGGSGVYTSPSFSSSQEVYVRVISKYYGNRGEILYSLGISVTAAPPPPIVSPPPPLPVAVEEKVDTSSQTTKLKRLAIPIGTAILLVLLASVFGFFYSRKKRGEIPEESQPTEKSKRHFSFFIFLIAFLLINIFQIYTLVYTLLYVSPPHSVIFVKFLTIMEMALYLVTIFFVIVMTQWKRKGLYGLVVSILVLGLWSYLIGQLGIAVMILIVLGVLLMAIYTLPRWRDLR